MGNVCAHRVAGQADDFRQLAHRQGFSQFAGVDLQNRRRHDSALGGRIAAIPAARIFRRGSAIYDTVRMRRIIETPPYPSTHNLGTNRMSEKSRDGVVNRWGRAHDIPNLFISDGSQFTTGGAENPTLTIVALAIRQAGHIAGEMSRNNL